MRKVLEILKEFKYECLFIPIMIAGAILFIEGNNLMHTLSPAITITPFWVLMICLGTMIPCSCAYIYFLIKKTNFKMGRLQIGVLFVFLFLLVNHAYQIFSSPEVFENTYMTIYGSFTLQTTIGIQTKIIYFSNIFTVLLVLYVALFIFPVRLKSFKPIIFVGYCMYAFGIVLLIISFVRDANNYVLLFKNLFQGLIGSVDLEPYAPKSAFNHRNIYAFAIEFIIYSAVINYATGGKKKRHLIFLGLFYINLLLTICKTGIILTTILLIVALVVSLFFKFKGNKKATIVLATTIESLVLIGVISLLVLYNAVPSIIEKINFIFHGGETIQARLKIWTVAEAIIGTTYLKNGCGYGIYNSLLYTANNLIYHDLTFSSHSWIVSTIGRGGLISLVLFSTLIVYSMIQVFRLPNKNEHIAPIIALLFGFSLFILHAMVEDMHYLFFLVIAEACYYSSTAKMKIENEKI